jgi:hypothetical protein
MHDEEDWINAFVMDPGWVQTDMGQTGAIGLGFESAPCEYFCSSVLAHGFGFYQHVVPSQVLSESILYYHGRGNAVLTLWT